MQCLVGERGSQWIHQGVDEPPRAIGRHQVFVEHAAIQRAGRGVGGADCATDQPGDGGVEDRRRDEVVVVGRGEARVATEIGHDGQRRVERDAAGCRIGPTGGPQFVGDGAFARPAIHEDEVAGLVLGEDEIERSGVDAAVSNDGD